MRRLSPRVHAQNTDKSFSPERKAAREEAESQAVSRIRRTHRASRSIDTIKTIANPA